MGLIKSIFRKFFPDQSPFFRFVFKVYSYKYWYPGQWKIDILKKYAQSKSDIFFVQIGSNNGVTGDPLFQLIKDFRWSGLLVEPVPYLFEELKENYKNIDADLSFENSAIASETGLLKFYRLKQTDQPGIPVWYDQLGSFRKEVILRQREVIPGFDDLLIEDNVHAITFDQLAGKHNLKNLNLIHIDTEGYDFEIIKLIPFERFEIDLIMYEHVHLTNEDYKDSIRILKDKGLILKRFHTDTIAIKKGLLGRLLNLNGNG